MRHLALFGLIALLGQGCIESNPQPSPLDKDQDRQQPDSSAEGDDSVPDYDINTGFHDTTDISGTPDAMPLDALDGDAAVEDICIPNCAGRACGSDGCGGLCGNCPDSKTCDETTGQCLCVPQCTDKECGPDGCGGQCGTCPVAAPQCGDDGLCHIQCDPACDGKECGPDGCGGDCGTCPLAAPICGEDGICHLDCVPACDGKECGPDGCGGQCGTCEADSPVCTLEGLCQPLCVPDCFGKECGPDGCGGNCGLCTGGTNCLDGICSLAGIADSLGTEFLLLDLDNYPDQMITPMPNNQSWVVGIVNPNSVKAEITINASIWPQAPPAIPVEANSSALVQIPSLTEGLPGLSDKLVSVTSTQPVALFQLNPLDAASATAGSSMTLPKTLHGDTYYVVTLPTSPLEQYPIGYPSQHGYFTVLASSPGITEVSVTLHVRASPLENGQPEVGVGTHLYSLSYGQSIQFQAAGSAANGDYDLTGAYVHSTKPVALFAGHEEAAVCYNSQGNCCADHVEEQLLPVNLLGNVYHCIKAKPRGPGDKDLWRIVAAEDNVSLATVPPVPGLNGTILGQAGDWVEVHSADSFTITASGKIQVAQFLSGKECSGGATGDPAMLTAIPAGSGATILPLLAPHGYSSFVTIVRPLGTTVQIPPTLATLAPGFIPMSNGTHEYAYISLPEGTHFITASDPIEAYIYGFSPVSAYGHPVRLSAPYTIPPP